MFSSKDNLKNPMKKDVLDIIPALDSWKAPTVRHISQGEYDQIRIHEPNTIYHILNDKYPRVYIGDQLIPNPNVRCSYLMGPADEHGHYSIYIVLQNHGHVNICEIARYNDVKVAIHILNQWNRVGYPPRERIQIRQSIINYVTGEADVNQFIIGIISMFGYRDDPRLQDVIQVMFTYGAEAFGTTIPAFAAEQIEYMRSNPENPLFEFYARLYDWIVKNNFFSKLRTDTEVIDYDEIDFNQYIDDIVGIMQE